MGLGMKIEPTYSISEVSKILERSVYWLRWKEGKMIGEGTFVRPDGTPLVIARSLSSSGKVESHSRRKYTIQDIEDMAWLFHKDGVYKLEATYARVMKRISLYKHIGDDE
jgi:hypothetical protein